MGRQAISVPTHASTDAPMPAPNPAARGRPAGVQQRSHRTLLSGGLGLRARVTATFAIGAFALSTIMAGITYFTARQSFLNERQATVQRQAFANASLIQSSLRSPGTDVEQLLELADPLPGSRSVLRTGGQWYATSISVG